MPFRPAKIPFNQTIAAITEYYFVRVIREDTPSPARMSEVACSVQAWVSCMPAFLRIAFSIFLTIFELYGILICGLPFRLQSLPQRDRQMSHWRNSPVKPLREFLLFFRKTVMFVYYSQHAQAV